MENIKKGFTLIELLIVIAILAILSTVVVLVLNPAELLKQARDSSRISALDSLRSASALYLATQNTALTTATLRCASGAPSTNACTGGVSSTATTVAGSGWVNINFTLIPGGSPLSVLPVDPLGVTSNSNWFSYGASNASSTFEFNANMESARFKNTGPDDVESKDGGNADDCYEVGTAQGLLLLSSAVTNCGT